MNDTRLTLISDPTQEFSGNTNVDFKVRLAEPLQLKVDNQWHVAMLALSTPNRPKTKGLMDQLRLASNAALCTVGFRTLNLSVPSSDPSHIRDLTLSVKIGDVFDDAPDCVTGVEFWKRVEATCRQRMASMMSLLTCTQNGSIIASYRDVQTQLKVDVSREEVVVEACYGSLSPSVFGLNIIVAKHFGLVKEKAGGGWEVGPNAHYDSFDYFGYNSRPALKTYWPLETDMQGDDECIAQRQMQIYFSRYKKWTFSHLNRSFGEVANIETSRAALVYCDLVQSTLVGNQKHPLLREITIPDSGGERQSVEPLHHQWLPVRNNVVEVVHVQVADPNGNLLKLPSGKTMVTVALKRA